MIQKFLKVVLFSSFVLVIHSYLHAQSIGDWQIYSSYSTINSISADNADTYYVLTKGGVFVVEDDIIISKFTTIDGMHRLDAIESIFDELNNRLIIAYTDGVIDVFNVDDQSFEKIDDIARVKEFTSKKINHFELQHNELYVATDFGVVVFDRNQLYVRDSYLNLGESRGTKVNDIEIVEDSIYTATDKGLAYGSLDDELSISSNWNTQSINEGLPSTQISCISYFNDEKYVVVENSLYKEENNSWKLETKFGINNVNKIQVDASKRLIISENSSVTVVEPSQEIFSFESPTRIKTVFIDNDFFWIGTLDEGVLRYSRLTEERIKFLPDGPFSNFVKGLEFDENDGVLLAASTNKTSFNTNIDLGKGYSIYDGESWKSFNALNNKILGSKNFKQTFTSLITSDYYYIGSWGQGIARHARDTDTIFVFNETNSALRGWIDDDPNYQVISGLGEDNSGDIWAVSRYGETPLYYQQPGDDDWIALPKHEAASGNEYVSLYIDSNNQKWITLENSVSGSGAGILVLNTGESANFTDDTAIRLTEDENFGMLPDNKVNAIIEDKNGEVWVGTERGISKFFSPNFIITTKNPDERRSQWLSNADTSATSRYLLRDINVRTMAVNGANQKWIGTVNQGVWLINEQGSEIIHHLTTENSSLISNNIFSITVNKKTGEVFFATDLGLQSYTEVSKSGVKQMEKLKIYPNPFIYEKNEKIVIDALASETMIKVIGADGTVVQELNGQSGRIQWNGLDTMGNRLGSGVYFMVAIDKELNSKGIGKIIIIN